jgi:hypothetical protein
VKLRTLGFPVLVVATVNVSGCLVNSVHQINHRSAIETGDAIVVVGVGFDAQPPLAGFSFSLDEYSMKNGRSTGNCFHYNHIEVQLPRPSNQSSVKYFAYKVPAGVYVWSAFNRTPAPGTPAFIASRGRAVYFGDYIYVGDHAIDQRSNLAAAQLSMQSVLPKNLRVVTADSPPAAIHGTPFLCTP